MPAQRRLYFRRHPSLRCIDRRRWHGAAATEAAGTEAVSITSDEELAAFVRRLLHAV